MSTEALTVKQVMGEGGGGGGGHGAFSQKNQHIQRLKKQYRILHVMQ